MARTSGLATASLVLACISVVLAICIGFLAPLTAVPAVVCGHLGRRDCQRDMTLGGEGFAIAGLIVGYVCLVIGILSALSMLVMVILALVNAA